MNWGIGRRGSGGEEWALKDGSVEIKEDEKKKLWKWNKTVKNLGFKKKKTLKAFCVSLLYAVVLFYVIFLFS